MLGRIYRALTAAPGHSILLINTVHDSFIFDLPKKDKELFEEILRQTIGKTAYYMKERFGIDINVPINYEINYGNSWYDCK